MKTYSIYWKCHLKAKENICQHLDIPMRTTVAGETDVQLPDGHPIIEQLEWLERNGWIKVRRRHALPPNDYYQRNLHLRCKR